MDHSPWAEGPRVKPGHGDLLLRGGLQPCGGADRGGEAGEAGCEIGGLDRLVGEDHGRGHQEQLPQIEADIDLDARSVPARDSGNGAIWLEGLSIRGMLSPSPCFPSIQ